MNHLAHLALAANDPDLLVGGFLGDYIKGRLVGKLLPGIERGIRLHRAIDRFTDEHKVPGRSRQRFDLRFRRYGGIMTDLAYDHLLAKNWQDFYEEPLADYASRTMSVILAHQVHLPEPARRAAIYMQEKEALVGYRNPAFLHRSLGHVAGRLKHENPLAEAGTEVLKHLAGLHKDLNRFYPELERFCDDWKKHH